MKLTSAQVKTAAGGLVLLLALAGCGSDSRRVADPPPDTAAYPVVQLGQANSVLDAVDVAVARGVNAKDTPLMVDARLLGPFEQLDLAQARISAERKQKVPRPPQVQPARLIVPTGVGWPRFFIAVGKSTDSSSFVLRVLSSPSARAPYGLWAQPMLLPGTTLPDTAQPTTGSAAIAPDAAGLVATPKEVLSRFAGYLNGGARTTSSDPFRRSIYSDQLQQRLTADRKGLKAVATVSSKHSVVGSVVPLAVRTTDGGALVVGELEQTYTITIKKGNKGHVDVTDPDLAALAGGKKKFSRSLTRTALEVVVFHVPAQGQGLITVIAAQKGDVRAVAR